MIHKNVLGFLSGFWQERFDAELRTTKDWLKIIRSVVNEDFINKSYDNYILVGVTYNECGDYVPDFINGTLKLEAIFNV